MPNPSELLPLKFGTMFEVNRISWDHFKGEVDESMPWSAHIYWYMDYKIINPDKKTVSVQLHLGKKSWAREEKKCDHLLNHEQGHFLIGSLCALEFLRRLDAKKKTTHQKFEDLIVSTFDRTMKEYIELQKKYDNETEHRLNFKKQDEWDNIIYEKLVYYQQIYDPKKNKFIKYSSKSEKKRN